MDEKRLKKVLIEIKNGLGLDYALHKGFVSPTCTAKKYDELYGDNSIGIYVRWFGKDQDQPQIRYLDKLYINHDLGSKNSEFIKTRIVNILSKYYDVDWDYSEKKSILIKEKGESRNAWNFIGFSDYYYNYIIRHTNIYMESIKQYRI